MTKLIVAVGLGSVLLGGTAYAQSLADLAKQEHARRKAAAVSSAVYSNADLQITTRPQFPADPRAVLDAVFANARASTKASAAGPRAYIDSYDKRWPFSDPPVPPAPLSSPWSMTTFIGPPSWCVYDASASLWNRGGLRDGRHEPAVLRR